MRVLKICSMCLGLDLVQQYSIHVHIDDGYSQMAGRVIKSVALSRTFRILVVLFQHDLSITLLIGPQFGSLTIQGTVIIWLYKLTTMIQLVQFTAILRKA